ncbi:MAG: AAA domain-containing protein [Dehalococcoidia bacterium]
MANNELSRLAPSFIESLDDEIRAARKQGGDRTRVSNGRSLGPSQGGWMYEFRLERETFVPDECGIELEVGKVRTQGRVISVEDFDILVELDEPLDEIPRSAVLIVKLWYILEKLQERLKSHADLELASDQQDLLAAAGRDHKAKVKGVQSQRVATLSPAQSTAVHQSLANPVTFIWGPPGTGKTTTVGALMAEAERIGLRCLLVAYSNAAVDVAMLQTASHFQGSAPAMAGRVLRLGTPRKPEVAEHSWLTAAAATRLLRPGLLERREHLRADLQEARRIRNTSKVDQIRAELTAVREEIKSVEDGLLGRSRILGCTLSKLATDARVAAFAPDVVVLDEASMASIPYAVLAATVARHHYIVAGDFRQLPPVVLADTEPAKHWLERNAFDHAGITEAVRNGRSDPRVAMLPEQHRMHPSISSAISSLFYSDRLVDGPRVATRTAVIAQRQLFRGIPIVVVDTRQLQPRCPQGPRELGGSRFNLMHALVDIGIAAGCLEEHETIAVIAPFRAQAKLLRLMTEDLTFDREKMPVSTVHRFQGSEADVVILDLCSAPPHTPLGPLLGGDDWSLAGRLLNVAISRARGKLFVIADTKHIQQHAARTDAVLRALQSLASHGKSIQLGPENLAAMLHNAAGLQGRVAFEAGHLYGGTVATRANEASELAFNVKTFMGAPGWLTEAGRRGTSIFISGENMHSSWNGVPHSRVREIRRNGNACVRDRSEIWVETEDTKWVAHLQLPETAKDLANLLHLIPDDQMTSVVGRPQLMAQKGPLGVTCHACGGPVWLDEGNYGPFLRCLAVVCAKTRNLDKQSVTQLVSTMGITCRDCDALPEVKQTYSNRGTKDFFLRCSRSGCEWTTNLRDLV